MQSGCLKEGREMNKISIAYMDRDWLSSIITDLETHHESKGDREQSKRMQLLRRFAAMFGVKV